MKAPRSAPWILAVTVLVVYAPSLGYGFLYDDHEVILEQAAPASVADVARIFLQKHGLPHSQLPYYRAVTRATLLVQKAIHGNSPLPFHAANVVLGAISAVLAYDILRGRAFAVPWPAAWIAAAIFSLHPIASSVVYPIASGRETLLPAVLTLFTLDAFLRGGASWRAAAVVGFAGALFGKEQAIVVPAVLLLADGLRLTRDPPGARPLRWIPRYLPFAAVAGVYLLLRFALFGPVQPTDLFAALRTHPTGPLESLGFALQVIWAPFADLRYEPSLQAWWSPARTALALAAAAGLGAAIAVSGRQVWRQAGFWLGFATLALLPTANFFPQETAFDERFVFLASLAPSALAALVVGASWGRRPVRNAALALGLAVAACLGVLSARRGAFFADGLSFATQWVRSDPTHANAQLTLGTVLLRDGRTEEAIAQLTEAVRLAPQLVNARYNLAAALAERGRLEESAAQFEALLRIAPGDAEAHHNLAVLRERQGRNEEASAHYREAERLERSAAR